jgi:TolB-like protein/serine/threonine protein kinase/Flp pilus assembly protein TadD
MGEVLLAEDTQLERLVAIKLMSAQLAKEPHQRKRFRTEAKAASGLSHPNICVIHEVGETEDGRPFYAMEFIEGQTLDLLMQDRRLTIREVLQLGVQIAEALEAARARRIVHRDIKPGNIMVDHRGQVKVLDFGLAKRFVEDGDGGAKAVALGLTQTGMLMGTPHYMSPEQVLGRELDHRSDIFSLGVVLYELIAGQKPFFGKTVGETINSVVNQRPGSLGVVDPPFFPALDRIILKCLEKDPNNRYDTAGELALELTQLKEKSSIGSAPNARNETRVASIVPASERRDEPTRLWQLASKSRDSKHGAPAITAGLVLLAATALGFYFVTSVGGRLVFSAIELLILSLGGWWWLARRTNKGQREKAGSGAALAGGLSSHSGGYRAGAQQKSLAVLPFANFSPEKDSDYLSDGLTEEITSALSRLPGLKVAARNSAFAFKGRHENARTIGEVLGVTMLLEGSVRKSGQQIRVTAQLVSVADGYHMWSESFDRDVSDVIAVQDEIARRIADRLRMEIGTETSAAMAQRKAVNPEAHVLYLQARHAWNKRTLKDIEHAVQLFRQAIDKDPAYADAHAGLAASYVILPGYSHRPAAEYLKFARSAAARALELDATSAEAHAVLGDAAAQVGDFQNAILHFRRVIELNPNYATGRQWYGAALVELGRLDEALVEFRKAEELDPLSPIIRACIPDWFYMAGRNDEAIAEAKRAVEIFPDFAPLRKLLAQALIRKGMYSEALTEIARARELAVGAPARLDLLAFCHARLGNEAEARRILADLEGWRKEGYDVDEEIGFVYVGLREYDKAIEAFERFVVSGTLVESTVHNPLLKEELADNPRFQDLLRKLDQRTLHIPTNTGTGSAAIPASVASGSEASRRLRPAIALGIVLIVSFLSVAGWLLFHAGPHSASTLRTAKSRSGVPQSSVAVLPFDNFSPEKDTDYLSDGLTEEITTALARRPGLKVVARNSAFTFKGRKPDLRKVGAALGVATLVEGSLSKSGQRVRITAQLINAQDGVLLWSETYDRSIEDVIAVQEDIAGQIAEQLHGEGAVIKRQVVAPEAHKLYLQGRVFWNKRTEAGLRRAIELFQQAIEKDPTYAAAHAALAASYMVLPQYSVGLRDSQYRPLARASANRALELDPSCAEAHAVLGLLLSYERDYKAGEEHFQRAIQLDPNYSTGHHWRGLCLQFSGRREEALVELQKALDLDPLSPVIHTTIPEWYYFGRDFDRAIAEARKVIETFPDFLAARLELILPLIQKGRLPEAVAEIDKARELVPDQPFALMHLKGFCLARLGQEAEARKILADLEQLRQQGKSTESLMAVIYQGLREYDKEFELAEEFRLSEGATEEILCDPALDEVRHLPQFQAFLQRAGLTNAAAP